MALQGHEMHASAKVLCIDPRQRQSKKQIVIVIQNHKNQAQLNTTSHIATINANMRKTQQIKKLVCKGENREVIKQEMCVRVSVRE